MASGRRGTNAVMFRLASTPSQSLLAARSSVIVVMLTKRTTSAPRQSRVAPREVQRRKLNFVAPLHDQPIESRTAQERLDGREQPQRVLDGGEVVTRTPALRTRPPRDRGLLTSLRFRERRDPRPLAEHEGSQRTILALEQRPEPLPGQQHAVGLIHGQVFVQRHDPTRPQGRSRHLEVALPVVSRMVRSADHGHHRRRRAMLEESVRDPQVVSQRNDSAQTGTTAR